MSSTGGDPFVLEHPIRKPDSDAGREEAAYAYYDAHQFGGREERGGFAVG